MSSILPRRHVHVIEAGHRELSEEDVKVAIPETGRGHQEEPGSVDDFHGDGARSFSEAGRFKVNRGELPGGAHSVN